MIRQEKNTFINKEMFNITGDQDHAAYQFQPFYRQKLNTKCGRREAPELSCVAGGSVNWYNHYISGHGIVSYH